MIWWPKYVGDWKRDTAELSVMEKGVYGEWLDYCYAKEKPLPLNFQDCCRIAGCTTAMEIRAAERVIKFFEKTESGYINQRCATEIAKWSVKSSNNTKAAEIRWERERARQAMIENGKK
jgi:uncharacterized protein YdaU (DUF1376 family)